MVRTDAPVKCMTVLVSERTDVPEAALARRLGLPVVTNDWLRECYIRKQLLPCQPFLLLDRSVEDKEAVILSADSDQYPDFVPEKRETHFPSNLPPPPPSKSTH